jgi:hypothetical protein
MLENNGSLTSINHVSNNRMRLYVSDGTTRIKVESNPVVPYDDQWHHLAVVVDRDAVITFYLDETAAGTFDISAFNGSSISTTRSFTIGWWLSSSSTMFNGLIDEVYLYDSALSAQDVTSLYDLYASNKSITVVKDDPLSKSLLIYSNPFTYSINLSFYLDEYQPVRIEAYDSEGKLVQLILEADLPKGHHEINWNQQGQGPMNRLPKGMYIIRMISKYAFEQQIVFKLTD